MKEKLLQFFTGKMGKAVYISIASAVVCGVVVITSTVIVHNNNQKIDSVLESLSASESVAELSSESVTESISDTDNTDSDAQAKAPNGEPAGDKALQYLAEYEKLTAEYKRKRAELVGKKYTPNQKDELYEPTTRSRRQSMSGNYLETEEEYAAYLEEFQKKHQQWEQEIQKVEAQKIEERRQTDNAKKQLSELDAQYEKDVAALKARYGVT